MTTETGPGMDQLDTPEGLDAAMNGSIDTYLAVLNCQCEALCTCDDTLALKAASMSVDTRPQGC